MTRTMIAATAFCAASFSASAAEITIALPEGTGVHRLEAVYACRDRDIPVEYINAGPISPAVLTIDGETIVAANVLAASGARYAGGQYIWHTKGDEASLFDLTAGPEAAPTQCTSD